MLAAVSGYQMFRVGQLWLIYLITDSTWFLGYAGVANALPGMFFNLFGGVSADKLDKRLLIMTAQATTASLIFLLATLTLLDLVQPRHILAVLFWLVPWKLSTLRLVRPSTPILSTARS